MAEGFVLRAVDGPSTGAMAPVDGPVVVGREGDLLVADTTVSRRHLRVEPSGDRVEVVDLGSSAGTLLRGGPVQRAVLSAGDELELGRSRLAVLRLARFPDAAAGPALRVRRDGRERVVAVRDGLTIGREPDCGISVPDGTVSRRHARLLVAADGVHLEDLGSANGTRVQGRAVVDRVRLDDGDVVELGTSPAVLTYSEGGARSGSVRVRVRAEGGSRVRSVSVDAGPEATVAQVTAELARVVEPPPGQVLLYRRDDGALLHPDDRWWATGPLTGDDLVLGAGDAAELPAADGRRWPVRRAGAVNQLPRTVWPEPPFVVPRIDAPESTSWRGRGILWQVVGGAGAVAIGLLLSLVRPEYAVFGMITGAIGVVSIAASILGEQSRRRHRVAEFRRRLADLDRDLDAAGRRQREALEQLCPEPAELLSWVSTAAPRLWERRPGDPDALRPTLGRGARPLEVQVERSRDDGPLRHELDEVLARHRQLDDVPVTGPGPVDGSLGLAGDPPAVRGLVVRTICEAAALHAPHQLRIRVAADDPGWEWCAWLPHVGPGGVSATPGGAAELLAEAAREQADPAGADVLHLVVVPEAGRWRELDDLLARRRGRELVVVAAPDRRGLPSGLSVVVDVDRSGTGTVVGDYSGAPLGPVRVAGMDEPSAERLAVALGRLGQGPERTGARGLVDLLGLGSAARPDVAGAWSSAPSDRLTVPVGVDDSGTPVTVGFRRDGPHGMVAGTTGSGKSELLQTLLAAEALRHPPDRLALFLIDFKGGATFAPLAPLPHVVGMVTDLEHDPTLAERAFTSLDAEIERRKRVLDAARVPDVVAYGALADVEPLPDLLVVIDEFALLVERQPEVRDRLDTVATQGRSLGIHLLLATQSPSGVITHAIRTNTNLWICLRVVTESESVEILGTRDAARIPDGSPGRAIIRLGAGQDLRPFQAARIARPVPDDEAPVRVTRLDGGGPLAPSVGGRTTELDQVVARMVATAHELGIARPAPLWLPPLPEELAPGSLPPAGLDPRRLQAVVGLADLPRRHAQEAHVVDLTGAGHALVTGVLGAGKTSTLLAIAADLAARRSPAEVHLYGLDAGVGSLGPLTALPHTGDVVGAHDVERLTRLVDRLVAEVERRRDALAAAGTADFARWRAAGGSAPWVVLLVDDFPAVKEAAEGAEGGRVLERFLSLLQHGPAVGVHLVVATPQSVDLRAREVNLMPARLVLRVADVADFALVDARFPPSAVPRLPAGRALAPGAVEVQVVHVDPDRFGDLGARWGRPDPSVAARSIPRLPVSLRRSDLAPTRDALVLGLGGPDVGPVEVRLDGGAPALLVAGPRESGRSSAVLGLLEGLLEQGAVRALVVAPRPGPLRAVHDDRCELVTDLGSLPDALDQLLADPAGTVLVLDDAEALAGAPGVADRLEHLVRGASDTGLRVVVAVRVNDLPTLFDPWARYLTSLRRAVLLQPTVDDVFLLGAKLPTVPPPSVPGRGVLVEGQRVTVVQVAAGGTP